MALSLVSDMEWIGQTDVPMAVVRIHQIYKQFIISNLSVFMGFGREICSLK